jgi:hypothetical protein
MRINCQNTIRSAVLVTLISFVPFGARAAVHLQFDGTFSGAGPANSTTPWFTAELTPEASGTVLFSLTASRLTDPENIASLYFNFNDALNVQNLNFDYISGTGFDLPTIDRSRDALRADGDGLYDIRLNFSTGGNVAQSFSQGDTLVYRLSYSSAITDEDFHFLSQDAGGHGPFFGAAHVQNTPGGGGWVSASAVLVPIPEASPMLAGGCAVLLFVAAAIRGRLSPLGR